MKHIYILRSEKIRLSKGIMFRTFHRGRSWRSSHDPPVVFPVQAHCEQQTPPIPTGQRGCLSDWQDLSHSGVSSDLSPLSAAAPRETVGHTIPPPGPCGKGLTQLLCIRSVHRQPGQCNYCSLRRPQPENTG